jgi:predicted transcriptional regulator
MTGKTEMSYSRRESQIMEIVFQLGQATVADVLANLPDPPTYSAVRATMRLLKEKGHLKFRQDGPRHVYLPTLPQEKARQSVLKRMIKTFFGGSTERAVVALLTMPANELSQEELDRLSEVIERARKDGI